MAILWRGGKRVATGKLLSGSTDTLTIDYSAMGGPPAVPALWDPGRGPLAQAAIRFPNGMSWARESGK